MDRLTNIVKQRLAAQQVGEIEHPSADTLAAFSEHGLRAAETQRIVSHLAVCPACRQTVALSVPDEQVGAAVPAARRPLVRFPMALRWASAVAAVAVGIGVGVLSYEHQNGQQLTNALPVQTQEKALPTAPPTSQLNSAPAKAEVTGRASRIGDRKTRVLAQGSAHVPSPELKKQRGGAVGGLIGGSHPQTALGRATVTDTFITASAPPPAPPPPPADAKTSIFADVAAAPSRARATGATAPAQLSQEAKSNTQLAVTGRAGKVTRSEFNAPASMNVPEQAASPAAMKNIATAAIGGPVGVATHDVVPIAHWTISSNGKLQRRTGDGKFTSIEPAPGVSIRAVAAQGIEVWAAGSQPDLSAPHWQQLPVLFHSSDAGETWVRIDGPWHSAITTLNLSSPNILTVVTPDGNWTTADAGKNWARK